MAETEQPYLRLYCVCGQKMKVTGSLFGRPGKCVACRQKIRIPRFEEIPEGTHEIHLKDHPEYLRGKQRPAPIPPFRPGGRRDVVLRHRDESDADESETPQDEDHVELTDTDVVSTAALDVLEPLRNLFSLGNKLQRQLESINKSDTLYAEVKGRLARVKRVREDLEEQLRQMLMEVAIELAMTYDKIAQTQLSARIGEISYDQFRGEIYKQRTRRDNLERRQQNLRGWIATTDVRAAGGFIEVAPDSIPDDGFRVSIPADPRTTAPLVDVHTSGLRDAFEARAKAERTLAELERMRGSSDSNVDWKQARANAKSTRTFADANIEFRRERLMQLRSDYEEDLETIGAQLDMVRNRMQSGQLDRAAYDKEEKKLARGKADLRKALSVIDRALSANSAPDVPQPKGTFLGRMAADEQGETRLPIENGLTWGAGALLALAVFLPLIGNRSPVGAFLEFGGLGSYSFLLVLLFAGVTAGAGFVRDVQIRVVLLGAAWVIGVFLAAWIMREAMYSTGAASARFRTMPPLWVRPGFIAIVVAAVCAAASLAMTMRRAGWWPLPFGAVLAVGLVLMVIAVTDVAGLYRPAPQIAVDVRDVADGRGQFAQIEIANAGGRPMFVLTAASDALAAYQLALERRSGNSWVEVPASAYASGVSRATERIGPGEALSRTASLDSGDYRVLLASKRSRTEELFSVREAVVAEPDALEPPAEPTRVGPTEESMPPAELQDALVVHAEPQPIPEDQVEFETLDETGPPQLEIAFQGAGARGENEYRLSFIVYLPDGAVQRVFVSLNEEIVDGWRATEYDPATSRVILVRGDEQRSMAPGQVAPFGDV